MRLLVAEEFPLYADGVVAVLARASPGAEVTCAASLDEAARRVRANPRIALALIDLDLPDSHGIETLTHFLAAADEVPVAVISADESPRLALSCLGRGAKAFIPKRIGQSELLLVLRELLERHVVAAGREQVEPEAHAPRLRDLGLTTRQIEVFRAVVQGKQNKAIARELSISESTIKKHVTHALRALGVKDRFEALIRLNGTGLNVD